MFRTQNHDRRWLIVADWVMVTAGQQGGGDHRIRRSSWANGRRFPVGQGYMRGAARYARFSQRTGSGCSQLPFSVSWSIARRIGRARRLWHGRTDTVQIDFDGGMPVRREGVVHTGNRGVAMRLK